MKKYSIILAGLCLSASMVFGGTATVMAEEGQADLTETAADQEAGTSAGQSAGDSSASAVQVEYGNLRELLKQGNLTLSKSFSDYQQNLDDYQEIWDTLKWEQSKMESEAEDMEDRAGDLDEEEMETAAVYASNAAMLKNSASRIYKQLDNMASTRSTKSLEKMADTYTISAQTMMNSYNQLRERRQAQEAAVQAKEASFGTAGRRYEAGAITADELKEEETSLAQAKNTLASLREQEAQTRAGFLTMLGLTGREVTIGSIPEPDLAAIAAIDFETDKQRAVNNSSNVQNERHAKASSTTQINNRFKRVAEAEGTEEASITAAYEALLASRSQYEAALNAYQSAELIYQSLERRKQAGMLSNTAYLQGSAEYNGKKANKEIASMNLVQAYESYCWEVKGRG